MKKKFKNIGFLLLMIVLLPSLSGCNNEDDVIGIFTGKTWKLSAITAEGNNIQYDFWNNNADARKKSMYLLKGKGSFTLNFEGTDIITGKAEGSFNGRAVSVLIDGQWSADGGKSKELKFNAKVSGSESDVFAKAFVSGIKNAFKYDGDKNNLFIYYTDEYNNTKRLGFKPQK